MDIDDDMETLAKYLVALAKRGLGLPLRMAACANLVGMNAARIAAARKGLVKAKRLLYNNFGGCSYIDGFKFGERIADLPEVEAIKDCLRRFYPTVVDLRTVKDENHVAEGMPEALIVGCQLMRLEEARDLAIKLAERKGLKLNLRRAGAGETENRAPGSA